VLPAEANKHYVGASGHAAECYTRCSTSARQMPTPRYLLSQFSPDACIADC
jgi:hypothetical protein